MQLLQSTYIEKYFMLYIWHHVFLNSEHPDLRDIKIYCAMPELYNHFLTCDIRDMYKGLLKMLKCRKLDKYLISLSSTLEARSVVY